MTSHDLHGWADYLPVFVCINGCGQGCVANMTNNDMNIILFNSENDGAEGVLPLLRSIILLLNSDES